MNAEPLDADVISVAVAKLDVPADAPVLYVTRDVIDGRAVDTVEVWIGKPGRERTAHGVTYMPISKTGLSYLGRYTQSAVREALGFVPEGDDCVCIDNPRVN